MRKVRRDATQVDGGCPAKLDQAFVNPGVADHGSPADLVWCGLHDGTLTALCARADVTAVEDERNSAGRFVAVRVDHARRVCLSGARILETWEE